MPFEPIGKGKFRSPSGRTFNLAQVRLYYALGERFPGQKAKDKNTKPLPLRSVNYAAGLKGK